jgi:hypothetical protein
MHKLIVSGAVATIAFAAQAHADKGVGVGKYVWNAKESHYSTGAYTTQQTMEITKNDSTGIAVSQVVTPLDGKTFSWHIEAPYDDKMRPGSQWMSFAFSRISDNQFHDRYRMNDSGIEGEETYTTTDKKLTIEGAAVIKGKKEPYVEVWDRVE